MFEVPHDNTSKLICVSSDDSGQLGHPSTLIRVLDDYYPKRLFCFSEKNLWLKRSL